MRSKRFAGLKEKDALKKDSGYFADPARQSEVGFYSDAKPSPWSLLKQGRISAASSFYPTFFWKTRRLGLMYVLLNSARKEGLKYGVELLLEYFYWKINTLLSRSTSSIPEYISLRKLIRKKLIPDVSGDNPSMAILRMGR